MSLSLFARHILDETGQFSPPNQVLNCLPQGQYPGSLLIKLALGGIRDFAESETEWEREALRLRKRTSYLLRVHVYQVFGLGTGGSEDERRGRGGHHHSWWLLSFLACGKRHEGKMIRKWGGYRLTDRLSSDRCVRACCLGVF